jgi:hypothetical protein
MGREARVERRLRVAKSILQLSLCLPRKEIDRLGCRYIARDRGDASSRLGDGEMKIAIAGMVPSDWCQCHERT